MKTSLGQPIKIPEKIQPTATPVPIDPERSDSLAEDLTRIAQTEREKRDLEQQRELARRQPLARYD